MSLSFQKAKYLQHKFRLKLRVDNVLLSFHDQSTNVYTTKGCEKTQESKAVKIFEIISVTSRNLLKDFA